MFTQEVRAEAFDRTQGNSTGNYGAIYEGFQALGIAESDITPRVNVLTAAAWEFKNRTIRPECKGLGVKVFTYIPVYGWRNGRKEVVSKRFKTAIVYHVSQTE